MALLRPTLRVRRIRDHDILVLARLYRQAFGPRGAGRGSARSQLGGAAVVALIDDRPVGFGCWERAGGSRSGDLRRLLACLDPTTRRILEADSDVDLPLRIEAPRGLVPTLSPKDRVFTAIAVDPAHRRQGIGTALAEARLRIAAVDGVGQVFVHAVHGSGSRELYEGLGFVPLVSKDHHYDDGTGMTLLYRSLR